MSDWQTKRLDSYINAGAITLGRGDVISKDDIAAYAGSYPIYSSSAHNNGKFGEYGSYMFDEELVTWSVDGGGSFFYRPKHKYSVTNVCGYMRINDKQLDAKFTYYSLVYQHRFLTFDYTTKAHPSVIKKLYWLPTLTYVKQKKIAQILQTIDQSIEKTEALIKKYQHIKAGLMHDLFTRGITADGKLRPPKEQAPELYQETPIGWIPKEWEAATIRDIAIKVTDGDHHTPIRSTEGVYLLSARNVLNGEIALSDVDYVPEFEYQRMIKRCHPESGDVLISCSGSVGRVSVVPDDFRCCLVRSAALIKLNREITDSRYIEKVMQSNLLQLQIKASQRQAAQPNLFQAAIAALIIPLPNYDEQSLITQRLNPCDSKIINLQKDLEKLQKLKSGLMHDLLTGKVSVNIN